MILASSSPLDHVVQHPFIRKTIDLPGLGEVQLTLLSDQIIMQIVAALLTVGVMAVALRRRQGRDEADRLTPRGLGNFIEWICDDIIRKKIAVPSLGPYADLFVPYLWTVAFFIWFSNMLGLVPLEPATRYFLFHDSELTHGHGVGGTPTGNLWVTGTLAVCTLLMIVINGLRLQGMHFVKHFFQGPFPISILIAFLEVVGLVAKTFALTMRLFANMVAGHVLLAVLLSFIAAATASLGAGAGYGIGFAVLVSSTLINLLELFVAGLQAFIFTFLTAMFIGQAVNIHHEGDHEEHGGEHAPAHAH